MPMSKRKTQKKAVLTTPVDPVKKLISMRKEAIAWNQKIKFSIDKKKKFPKETSKKELTELVQLFKFLNEAYVRRLELVKKSKPERMAAYIKVLEPFYSKEGLQQFVRHHFSIREVEGMSKEIEYLPQTDFEKEVSILYDLFKVKKTIETITTLQQALTEPEPFPSIYSLEERREFLGTLKEILKFFFIRFVKPENLKTLFKELSESQMDAEQLLELRQKKISFIRPEVLKSNEVREKLIVLFFTTEMRTLISNKPKDFHFNYLYFEIIKNEFLVDWMQRKLQGSPVKEKVLRNYQVGGKSVASLIRANPEKEAAILAALPIDVFNDAAEQVNEHVGEEEKSPVSTFSKKFGKFAAFTAKFEQAKELAKSSLLVMQKTVFKNKIWTVRDQNEKVGTGQQIVKRELKTDFNLELLKEEDLDFAYFDLRTETYKNKIEFLRKKMGGMYGQFKADVWELFQTVAEQQLLKRMPPAKEWAIPFLFEHLGDYHLLIVGAEIANKFKGMGYRSQLRNESYEFNSFFVYAVKKKNEELGKPLGQRLVRGNPFHCYSYTEENVQMEVMKFFSWIIKNRTNEMFKTSNILYRDQVQEKESAMMQDIKNLDDVEIQAHSKKAKILKEERTKAEEEARKKQEDEEAEKRRKIQKPWEASAQQLEELKNSKIKLKI